VVACRYNCEVVRVDEESTPGHLSVTCAYCGKKWPDYLEWFFRRSSIPPATGPPKARASRSEVAEAVPILSDSQLA